MRVLVLVFTVLTSALPLFRSSAFADGTSIRTTGYIRNFIIITDYQSDTTFDALSRLRIRFDIRPDESTSLEFAYELLPRFREQGVDPVTASLPTPALFSYRAFDLDKEIYPDDERSGGDFILTQNLDRAYLTLSTPSLDISIGRQPVAFGSARVINPTDIIAPFTYDTIAKEELVGVDAVRVKRPVSEMAEIDLGLIFGKDFEPDKSAGFIRLKSYLLKTDISFMAMVFRENILLGLDLARSIGGASAWFEAAQTLAGGASHYKPGENYFRLSAGSDYGVTPELYAYLEYHYSGSGTGDPENYFDAAPETAFTDGAVYLLGRHYIAPGFTYEITPLLVFSAQALVNIEDGSALASTGFEYSVTDDVYAELRVYSGLGEESPDPSNPENEFGLYPDVYYTALNVYF